MTFCRGDCPAGAHTPAGTGWWIRARLRASGPLEDAYPELIPQIRRIRFVKAMGDAVLLASPAPEAGSMAVPWCTPVRATRNLS